MWSWLLEEPRNAMPRLLPLARRPDSPAGRAGSASGAERPAPAPQPPPGRGAELRLHGPAGRARLGWTDSPARPRGAARLARLCHPCSEESLEKLFAPFCGRTSTPRRGRAEESRPGQRAGLGPGLLQEAAGGEWEESAGDPKSQGRRKEDREQPDHPPSEGAGGKARAAAPSPALRRGAPVSQQRRALPPRSACRKLCFLRGAARKRASPRRALRGQAGAWQQQLSQQRTAVTSPRPLPRGRPCRLSQRGGGPGAGGAGPGAGPGAGGASRKAGGESWLAAGSDAARWRVRSCPAGSGAAVAPERFRSRREDCALQIRSPGTFVGLGLEGSRIRTAAVTKQAAPACASPACRHEREQGAEARSTFFPFFVQRWWQRWSNMGREACS